MQGDAQIITAGTITSGLSLSRNSTAFGLTGWRSRPNNFIVAAESAATSMNSSEFWIGALRAQRATDNSFGRGGLVTTNFGSGTSASIAAIVLQSDGKKVVVGQASNSGLAAARYLGR